MASLIAPTRVRTAQQLPRLCFAFRSVLKSEAVSQVAAEDRPDAADFEIASDPGSDAGQGRSATEEEDLLYGFDLSSEEVAPLVAAEQMASASRPPSPPLVRLSHPEDLPAEELVAEVKPTDAQLALCSLYANRWHTSKRLEAAAHLMQHDFDLQVYDQFEDRKVGLRMVTFISPIKHVNGTGRKVAAAVFTFRGTRADKFGNIRADFQVLKDRNADLFITQRGIKHVRRHVQRLSAEYPDVQWGFFATGHSLGGFTATTCTILCDRILHCTTYESPGLTTFYQKLAANLGDEAYWRGRVTNYLGIPNPITMVNRHLGRLFRVHLTHIQCRTDLLHVLRCLFGTIVRLLNWMLLAQAIVRAVGLVFGIPSTFWACTGLLATEGSFEMVKVLLMRECGVEMVLRPAHLASSAYWTLRNAGAYVAGRLGATAAHLYQQHSMWHMAASFDPKTGVPHAFVEMASWPRMERVTGMFGVSVRRALLESFWPTQSCEGIFAMFNRHAMIEARVCALPGYVELTPVDASVPFWGEDMPFWDPRGLVDITSVELHSTGHDTKEAVEEFA
ncbi:hypothetical protein WJX72_003209 [[Myrmecia] bisecta]|uniref:Fungal lipase-like domain-containing protein n=1 Tax=[Myrmecia] bisecta TaxID=41462 RepID=A0AAW1PG22_9CHLO